MNLKKAQIKISILTLLFTGLQGYAQSGSNMNQTAFKIPLHKGENKVTKYKTLEITPVNLFIQDKPWNDKSANIQLELSVKTDNKPFKTFLWYFQKDKNPPANYPQASGKYIYSLEISPQETIQLTVDTLSFEKPFFLTLGQDAKIGDLTVNFTESMDVMGARSENEAPSNNDSYAEYYLALSENKEQKTLSFFSSNVNNKAEQSLKWGDYEIIVLYDDLKLLKLIVYNRKIKK